MQRLLRDAIYQRKLLNWVDIKRNNFFERLEDLLAEPLESLDKEFGRIQRSLRKLKDTIFAFLYDENLPYDNNGAERAMRKTKIKMKVSQGFRFDNGAKAFSILHSVMDTARKNGQSQFNAHRTIAAIE